MSATTLRPAGDTVILKETPPDLPWPLGRPRVEDQPTAEFLRSDLLAPDAGLLADVVAAVPYPIVALNAEGQVVVWSDAAAAVFGWTAAEAFGRPPPFLPHDRCTEHARQFVQATAGVRVREVVTERRHRDGRPIRMLLSMTGNGGGGVTCVYQSLGDVPMAGPVEVTPPPKAVNRAFPHAGETALLADDDEGVRAAVKATLEALGYGVIEADDGDEAARLARAVRSLDLLVTDVVLPGLSGHKLTTRLRAARLELPVVLISGYPQPRFEPQAGLCFVRKPFLPADLLAAVRKVTREAAWA